MTNLEANKDKIKLFYVCRASHICKYGKGCYGKSCDDCEFDTDKEACIKALLEEHKEPIKLKQWEYDLIRTNDMSHDREFRSFNTYQNMKVIGYFKGITDTSMTLKEILNNCEVVEK